MSMKSYFSKIEYEALILLFMAFKLLLLFPYFSLTFATASGIISCFFIAWYLGRTIRRTDDESKKSVIFFTVFLLASPIFNNTLFAGNLTSPRVTINNAVLLLGLFLIFDSLGRNINVLRTPVLCFMVCAVFPASAIFFIPVVITLYIVHYRIKDTTLKCALLGVSCVVAGIAAFLLFGGEILQAATFTPLAAATINWKGTLFRFILIFPFAVAFPLLWIKTIKINKERRVKIVMLLILVGFFKSMLFMVLNTPPLDFVMISVLEQYCYMLYLLNIKNVEFISVMHKSARFFENNLVPAGLALIYLSAFSLFNSSVSRSWFGN